MSVGVLSVICGESNVCMAARSTASCPDSLIWPRIQTKVMLELIELRVRRVCGIGISEGVK